MGSVTPSIRVSQAPYGGQVELIGALVKICAEAAQQAVFEALQRLNVLSAEVLEGRCLTAGANLPYRHEARILIEVELQARDLHRQRVGVASLTARVSEAVIRAVRRKLEANEAAALARRLNFNARSIQLDVHVTTVHTTYI